MTRALFRGSDISSFHLQGRGKLTDTPCDLDLFSVSNNRVGLWWGENTARGINSAVWFDEAVKGV
jgi:hypothetical protein